MPRKTIILIVAVIALLIVAAVPAFAQVSGAIFTTDDTCGSVNKNIFAYQEDVYLNGGPKGGGAGLPEGFYFVKVTTPDGDLLGYTTTASVEVDSSGAFVQCYQLWVILVKASDGTQGYDPTTNPGGEYKVWASQFSDFPNNESKTDNFKVRLAEEYEALNVTKTADTSYTRTHDWSIAKSVDPTELFVYIDDRGTPLATWTVDVTYEDYIDSAHVVSGTITIENTGNLDAVITAIDDELAGMPIPIDCGDEFELPYTLPVSETLICTYYYDEGYVEGMNEVTVTTEVDTYFDDAEIIWGDPTSEVNANVAVTDLSDWFGAQVLVLDTVTAPNDDQFTYDHEFLWAEFGQDECGANQIDNTASVIGDNEAVLDTADATLIVYVQCYQDETAWAANNSSPGSLRYNNRGNWATYVVAPTNGTPKTVNIYAGKTIYVGTATFTRNGSMAIVINLTGGAILDPTTGEAVKIQGYASAPSGNPAPGLFTTYKGGLPVPAVPIFNYYGVHLDVWVPDPDFGPTMMTAMPSTPVLLPGLTR